MKKTNRSIFFNILGAVLFAFVVFAVPCMAQTAKQAPAPRAATDTVKAGKTAAKPAAGAEEKKGDKNKKKPLDKKQEKDAKKTAKKPVSPADRQAMMKKFGDTTAAPDDITYKDDFSKNMPAPEVRSPVIYLGRVILSMFIVIALIISTVYVLKYFYSRGLGLRTDIRGRHIRTLDTLQLGVNRTVYLVKIGSKIVLLGTGDRGLTFLADATDAVDVEEIDLEPQPEGPAAGLRDFRKQFNQALGKRRGQSLEAEKLDTQLKDRLKRLEEDEPRDA